MTRDQLHNIIVQAFAKGVEKAMEPLPSHIRLPSDHAELAMMMTAHLAGAARKYAEEITSAPSIIMSLD